MALRCPECKSVDGFSVTFELEAEVNEHEHLKHKLDTNDYALFNIFDIEDCTCVSCGHKGTVHEFRDCHNNYMPDAKTAFIAIWTGMSEMNDINDAICEKDSALGKAMHITRHRLYDLLGQLEKMVKKYEYNSQRH